MAKETNIRPADGLPGTWEALVDPEVLAAAERRILELEAEISWLREHLELANKADWGWQQTALATEAREQVYRQRVEALHSPCQCEPPGSGDACNGCCGIRAALKNVGWIPRSGEAWLKYEWMLAAFDAAVTQGRGEKTI